MIKRIGINNYRLLKNFSLDLTKFTCLIGLNGSGKTTLLQALEGIGRLAHGEERMSLFGEDCISFGLPPETPLRFSITFDDGIVWDASFDVQKQKFVSERILHHGAVVLDSETFKFAQGAQLAKDASLLVPLDWDAGTPPDIVKKGLQSLKNLGLLSPALLRKGSGRDDNEIYNGGEGFAGFLYNFNGDDGKKLNREIKKFYKETNYYNVTSQGGGRYLHFKEKKNDFPAWRANDGLLRTLAILSQRYSPQQFVLFDEIENGFNQELVEELVKELLDFNGKQVMVTTHSALVVNFIPDEIAKESLVLLFKDSEGFTKARRFFDLDENRRLLKVLPSGQIMSQSNLVELSEQFAREEAASCGS